MNPQEVTDALKLSSLKDKVWFVVPSCATTGEGLLEGLVNYSAYFSRSPNERLTIPQYRLGYQTTSNHLQHRRNNTHPFQNLAVPHNKHTLIIPMSILFAIPLHPPKSTKAPRDHAALFSLSQLPVTSASARSFHS